MVSIATNKSDLKKRVLRFLDPESSRSAVRHFVDELSTQAKIYMFGGLLRDIALFGTGAFKSDIDLVFVGKSADVQKFLADYDSTKNKFGGYRINVGNWQVDLWEASKTWAFKEGYVEYLGVESLLKTTITNWDAILYDWRGRKVICGDSYFKDLSESYLDVVLDKNPNKTGMYVKLLRCYLSKEAYKFSPEAALLVGDAVKEYEYTELAAYEKAGYEETYISESAYNYLLNSDNVHQPELFPIELARFNRTSSLL